MITIFGDFKRFSAENGDVHENKRYDSNLQRLASILNPKHQYFVFFGENIILKLTHGILKRLGSKKWKKH
jgi:hypothetical protein